MKYLVAALVLLLTAGAIALSARHDPDASGPVQTDRRVVQAPATAAPSASPEPAKPAKGGPVSVGFTLLTGKLYLVTAKNRAAAARVMQSRQPVFTCAAGTDPKSDLEAWPLRNAGGGGALPGVTEDGTLLTAPGEGSPIPCTVQDGARS